MLSFSAIGHDALGRFDSPEAEPTTTVNYQVTFSEYRSTSYTDWDTPTGSAADFDSFLYTYYVIPEDAMHWMQSPYIYVFVDSGEQETVIDSTGDAVVDSDGVVVVTETASLFMNTVWDWADDTEENTVVDSSFTSVVDSSEVVVVDNTLSPKVSRDIQVYRFRDGYSMAVSKNKIRGRGKTLKIKFRSADGVDFNLLGWTAWISKNGTP